MTDRIEGKVARILTGRDLVFNRGAQHGVQVGMQFKILNRNAAKIKDPETGQVLGSLEWPKAVVKVVQVDESMSVARTFREFSGISLGAFAMFSSKSRPETLKTDEASLDQELSEKDSLVKTGDAIVQILHAAEPGVMT